MTFRPALCVPLPDEGSVKRANIRAQQTAHDVIMRLAELFERRGMPKYIRSDNGPEFTAAAVREWLGRLGVETLSIEPGSPWENGYVESFQGKLRDELLEREVFDTVWEAQVLVERWRHEYNTVRPHSALGYRPPAPEAIAWPSRYELLTALRPPARLAVLS